MTRLATADARLAGIILLFLVLLLLAEGIFSARGGYNGAFWAAERDRKIEHIAENTRQWTWIGIAWVLYLAAMTTGLSAFSVLLAQAGEPVLAAVALGLFLLGAFSCLVFIILQFGPSGLAARVQGETGVTPGWLEPLWIAVSWAEVSYIMLTSLAYVVWGVGAVISGVPTIWAGWTSMVVGGVSVIGLIIARSRFEFPQLALVVPIVLGVALLIN
ncbi:MAG TPA: hypothetical protein VHL52_10020 [Acidimicrobiia bacterium]|nr:hypothetical protein [Acidimicrobiia bacterium]